MTRRDDNEPPFPAALWGALSREEPDPQAVQRAYFRFQASRGARRVRWGGLRWVTVGLTVAWGGVYAATGDPLFGALLLAHPSGERRLPAQPAPNFSAERRPRGSANAAGASTLPGTAASSTAPSTEGLVVRPSAAAPNPLPGATQLGALPAPVQPSSPSTSSGALPEPPLGGAGNEQGLSKPQWRRVTEALRASDYTDAQAALMELEEGGLAEDREAASLSLAQLLVARGQVEEARPRLEQLSVAAHSARVRAQAAALLTQIDASRQRSADPPAATH
jgi:hypothetical protein